MGSPANSSVKGGMKMCHHHEFGCGHSDYHAHWSAVHHHWGCCGGHDYPVRQPTKEEVLGQLEQHLSDLQAEAKAVEERIDEMKNAG